MNILLLNDIKFISDRLHRSFIDTLGFSHNVHVLKHDKPVAAKECVEELNLDAFLIYQRESLKKPLPIGLSKIDIPRIIVEVDYFDYLDEESQAWYKRYGDLLVLRGWYDDTYPIPLPTVWLPYSADMVFCSDAYIERINKVLFLGSHLSNNYTVRKVAIDILGENNLLGSPTHHEEKLHCGMNFKISGNYEVALRAYTSMLSTNPRYSIAGKVFEGMASGTAILSNYISDTELLFGDKQCYFEFKDDCSNIVDVAKTVLADKDLRNHVIKNAADAVHKEHMHIHRIEELDNIITKFVTTGEVYRRWGI